MGIISLSGPQRLRNAKAEVVKFNAIRVCHHHASMSDGCDQRSLPNGAETQLDDQAKGVAIEMLTVLLPQYFHADHQSGPYRHRLDRLGKGTLGSECCMCSSATPKSAQAVELPEAQQAHFGSIGMLTSQELKLSGVLWWGDLSTSTEL